MSSVRIEQAYESEKREAYRGHEGCYSIFVVRIMNNDRFSNNEKLDGTLK